MNKSVIALAVAAALGMSAAAQADTTLYGSVRVSVDYYDPSYDMAPGFAEPEETWDVVNQASRLGVKGSEDLGGGLSAIYHYEFGVDAADSGNIGGRLAYVGLRGGFGEFTIGRQWTPLNNALDSVTDDFNGTLSGAAYNASGINGTGRVGNQLIYTTPDFAGFTAQVGLVVDGSDTGPDNEDADIWMINGVYQNGGLFVGAGYQADERAEQDTWGVGAGYDFDFGLYLGGLYMSNEDTDVQSYDLLAKYTFGGNVLRASWGRVDPDEGEEADTWIVGYQYNLSKRTRVWAEYGNTEDPGLIGADPVITNTAGNVVGVFDDANNLSIGIRHDF
ncbi:MAG TPA: porin [Candidatus Competibacteraceae bacterium]|nr:porin [Candidatus Competibacteraceae bacterium]